jgi:hypothetical protein
MSGGRRELPSLFLPSDVRGVIRCTRYCKRESQHQASSCKRCVSIVLRRVNSVTKSDSMRSTPLSLHKYWPSHTHTDISLQREQKYLLHNRSNCRYRNRAQIARPVLEVGLTGCNCHERRIVAADAQRRSALHCHCRRRADTSNSKSVGCE